MAPTISYTNIIALTPHRTNPRQPFTIMHIQRLAWDSDFFGRSIGRWRTPNLQPDNLPDPSGFDLIYVEAQETP